MSIVIIIIIITIYYFSCYFNSILLLFFFLLSLKYFYFFYSRQDAVTDNVQRFSISYDMPTDIQIIQTAVSDLYSSVNISKESFFILQYDCSDFGFQKLFNMKVTNVTYDNIIVRTQQLNADVSSEFLESEILNMIQYCYQHYFNLKAKPLNSNFLEKFDLISLFVERTEVRSDLEIGEQNIFQWEIIFFSNFPLGFEINFPILIVENFLFCSTPRFFYKNKIKNYEYENTNNNTNEKFVNVSLNKKKIVPISGNYQINIGGEKTSKFNILSSTEKDIENEIKKLLNVNEVSVRNVRTYKNAIESDKIENKDWNNIKNENKNKNRLEIMYEIVFQNKKNWYPNNYNFPSYGFKNNFGTIDQSRKKEKSRQENGIKNRNKNRNENRNENKNRNRQENKNKYENENDILDGSNQKLNKMWRPLFGNIPKISIDIDYLIGYDVSTYVTVEKEGSANADILEIIISDLNYDIMKKNEESIYFSSLDIFVLPTADRVEVKEI